MKRNPNFEIQLSTIFAVVKFAMLTGWLACISSLAFGGDSSDSFGGLVKRIDLAAQEEGFTFSEEYTGEGLANLSGGLKTGAVYEGLLLLTQELDLKRFLGWTGASIFSSQLYPHGKGLSDQHTGDLNILSNITAYNSFR